MVAKSEASVPMSRALAKLAVATDLGTAARPSSAMPAPGSTTSLEGAGKMAQPLPSRPYILKPSTAWPAPAAPTASGAPAAATDGSGPAPLGPPPSASAARLPPLPLATAPQAAATAPNAFLPAAASGPSPVPAPTQPPPHTLSHLQPRPNSLPPGLRSASVSAGGSIGEDLLEAARKHPGLPPSLLAQLHAPRRAGGLPSAPAPLFAPAAAVAEGTSGLERPLSARARARATAAVIAGGAGSGGRAAAAGAPAPAPAAVASLSPAALALLLAPPQRPGTGSGASGGSGVLTMRRAAPVVGSTGTALRPSTASSNRGGSGGGSGSGGQAAAPGMTSVPPRPTVQPHTAVPYKPGSIRLPPSATPAASVTVLSPLPDRPATAAPALAGAPSGAGGASLGGLRPPTASPLTHSLSPDTATSMLLRVPKTAAGTTPAAASDAAEARGTSAAPGVSPGPVLAPVPGASGSGEPAATNPARQLNTEELRAVVAALAAARPHTAAMLLRQPATTAQQDSAKALLGPSTSTVSGADAARCPGTARGAFGATGMEGRTETGMTTGAPAGTLLAPGPSGRSSSSGTRTSTSSGGGGPPSARPASGARPRSGSVRTVSPPRPGSGRSQQSGGAPGSGGRRTAATARATARRALQPIPEDAELAGAAEAPTLLDALSAASPSPSPPPPLEPLEPDPLLDAAWAAIVAANQRPDSAAVAAPGGSINVFSRPGSSAPLFARQAAPMVLVLDDISASTPEVVEHELAHMSLEQLQALREKLMG